MTDKGELMLVRLHSARCMGSWRSGIISPIRIFTSTNLRSPKFEINKDDYAFAKCHLEDDEVRGDSTYEVSEEDGE